MSRASRTHAALLLALVVLVAIAFHDVIGPARSLYFRDHLNIFRPRWEAVRNGQLGITAAIPSGIPIEGSLNLAIFTPLTLILFLGPFDVTYDLFILAHFVLLGAGAYVLALRLGARPVEAFVAGAISCLAGPVVALENLLVILQGLAWTPWILWAAQGALQTPDRRAIGWLGLFFGFQGQAILPELLVIDLAGLLVLAVASPPRSLGGSLRALSLGALLGLAICAITLGPGLEVMLASARGEGFSERTRGVWSLSAGQLVDLIAPSFWMPPDAPFINVPKITGTPQGPFLTSLYLGTALILAFAGLAGRGRVRAALVVVLAIALLLALGTPLHRALTSLPLFSSTRYPVKYMLLATAALAAAAPLALRSATPKKLALFAILHLGLVVALRVVLDMPEVQQEIARSLGNGGTAAPIIGLDPRDIPSLAIDHMAARSLHALIFAIAALAAAAAAFFRPALASPLLAACVALDLAIGATHTVFGAAVEIPGPPKEIVAQVASPYYRIFEIAPNGRLAPVRHEPGETYAESMIRSTRLRQLHLQPGVRRYHDPDTEQLSNPVHAWAFREVESSSGQVGLRLMARAGVSVVTSWIDKVPAEMVNRYEIPGERPEHLFLTPSPRAYVEAYTRWQTIERDAMKAGDFGRLASGPDAWTIALLHGTGAPATISTGCPDQAKASGTPPGAIDVDAPCDAIVVMLEAPMPGWRATVDGKEARVLTAEMGAIAVHVPSGKHHVSFEYALRVPRLLPLFALGVLLALILVRGSARGAEPRPPA